MNSGILLAIMFAGVLGIFVYSMSTTKTRCFVHLSDRIEQRIEKWVPFILNILYGIEVSRIGRYDVGPRMYCNAMVR